MACNSSSCQSGCYRAQEEEEEAAGNSIPELTSRKTSDGCPVSVNGDDKKNLCVKCKVNEPMPGCGVSDDGHFCGDCFRSNMFSKFRHTVTSNAMISPTDNVLVAFSGGPSSRVALQFVHEMQLRSHKNFEASKDRSLSVFGVGVVFIAESAACPVNSPELEDVTEDVQLIVSSLSPPEKKLHVAQIESIFGLDADDGREKLNNLLDAVSDPTGKEDILLHLRMLLLQKIAVENGYNRLLLGSCTSRIACHVISATVKGRGYSLPADIQYADARWEVPVVLPLRDCLMQDLNMLCKIDGLKTVELVKGPCTSINGLVSSFVKLLQEENPSRECTIVRTAGKLTPFHFNRIPEITDNNVPLATRRRQKRSNNKHGEYIPSETFCPICRSPLSKSDFQTLRQHEGRQSSSDLFGATCCSTCRFQILPGESSSMERFFSLLPQPMVAPAKQHANGDLTLLSIFREQVEEFLLSDGES